MKLRTLLILVTLMVFVASMAAAHEGSSHAEPNKLLTNTAVPAKPDGVEEKARSYFTDLPVVTQDGQQLRFFSDVLKDRVVLISLFYTNCKEACPLTTEKLAQVQDQLQDDMGRDFLMVSITLDPEHDTPEILKRYADKFAPKEGWLFLTGEKQILNEITRRLGHTIDQIEAHNVHYMIGNVKIARWAKIPPHLPAEIIAERLRLMANYTAAN